MSDIGQFALFFAVGLGSLGFFFGPVGKALGRRLESHTQKGGDPERLRDLETRLAELEAGWERLGEMEERLEFAERLLARQGEPGRLVEGGS